MKQHVKKALFYSFFISLTVICLFPFYILIVNATRAHPDIMKGFSFFPGGSTVTNFRSLMAKDNLPVASGIWNSLFIATATAGLTVYFSALTAYALHAYEFKFKKAVFLFIMMIMMVPPQVSTLGFIRLVTRMGLMDSFIPLILPSIAAPVVFFFMKQYMESGLPLEIIEAARIDGAGEFYTFNKIVIPIIKPALAVQAIFSFVTAWNNYFVPGLILKSNNRVTLPILIARLRSADYLQFDMGVVYMMIAISIVPVVIVYFFLSKFIIRGVTLGSVKG